MRRRFIALAPADPLLEAERLMRMARVRFLPVADAGLLVGGLSHRALLGVSLLEPVSLLPAEAFARWLRETPVAEVMAREPVAVTPETQLVAAAALLLELCEGCLPVVEDRGVPARLLGVLTESDLLRAAFELPPR
jgi:CBS domain-containing protein